MNKIVIALVCACLFAMNAQAQESKTASFRYSINSNSEVNMGLMFEKEYAKHSVRFSLGLQPQKNVTTFINSNTDYAKNTFEQLSFGVAMSVFKIAMPEKPLSAKFFINAGYKNRSYGITQEYFEGPRNLYLGNINFYDLYLSNQLNYQFTHLALFFEPAVGVRFTQNNYENTFINKRIHSFVFGVGYTF